MTFTEKKKKCSKQFTQVHTYCSFTSRQCFETKTDEKKHFKYLNPSIHKNLIRNLSYFCDNTISVLHVKTLKYQIVCLIFKEGI